MRRPLLKPWQRARMVSAFLADRDQRTASVGYRGHQPRFKVGQRVRMIGGWRDWTVTGVLAGRRVNRYHLEGWQHLVFESDLQAAQ